MIWVARTFKPEEHQINVRTEVPVGLTVFLTMAYIIFVNPNTLAGMDMPHDTVFAVTCTAAAIGTITMGIYANCPITMTPGMGLNAYFAYAVVKGMGFTWQAAPGVVFISGCLSPLVSVFRIREMTANDIPYSTRVAITAGIGLFLDIVSLRGAGPIVGNPAMLAMLGDVHQPSVILAVVGFFMIVALDHLRVKGAIPIGILAVAVASFFSAGNTFHGVVPMPSSLAPTLLQLDIMGVLSMGILNVVLVFFLVELFDATGTLMGVANRAGLLKQGKMDCLNKALLADSIAITAGSLLGTSSTTAYIENTSGVQASGRTGLATLTVVALFLLCLFFSPLAGVMPAYAATPVLLYVSCLMLCELVDLNWEDTTEAVPAVLTALMMPFTYSIANGVAFGFITYFGLKLFTGRMREVPVIVWTTPAVLLFRFFYLSGGH